MFQGDQGTSVYKRIFGDIRFWIIVFFLLRLYGITYAPLENGHNWRQSLTNMIARNFLQSDNNIFYPRIDYDGNNSGIIGSEFPLFNYLIYVCAKVGGYTHWYGRLINLIVSSLGIWYFFRIVKRFFSPQIAFNASMLLLASIWFAFSRKSMPDTFCISLMIIALWYALVFLYDGRSLAAVIFVVLGSIAVLCKIPAVYLLVVLAAPYCDAAMSRKRKIILLPLVLVIIALMYAWYFHWVPYLLATYGYQLYFPKGIIEGIKEISTALPDFFEKFYFSALAGYISFTGFLAGLYFMIWNKHRVLLLTFLLCGAVFLAFVAKTGLVFPKHNYYVIPFVPVMALVAGYGISFIRRPVFSHIVIALAVAEALLNQQHDFRLKDKDLPKQTLEAVAERFSTRKDLFLINGGKNPQLIYFLNRRGWSLDTPEISKEKIAEISSKGCRYIMIWKEYGVPDVLAGTAAFYSNDDLIVYLLSSTQ